MAVIETEKLTKYYGPHRGVVEVDLAVEEGEIYGFLGPNGAGKTTTIRLLLDLLRPTSGRALVFGIETTADPVAIHRRIGYLPGEFALFDRLTGAQTIEYFGNLRGGVDPLYQADLVARFDLDPSVRWTAFPRVTKDVFVTTKLVNTTGTPLPAGEARVFVGPDFTGRMALADWGMGKEVDVGLGVDREVEAEREALVKQRSTEGIFSKDTVHERGFRITVTNHRARSIDVRLLDQIPVSADEDIEVELTETSLAFAKLPEREEETNKARGVLEWRFGVAAQAKQEVRFAFTVTHPKSTPIVGFDD